jgi:transcriptional regulator with XRE-family HTH domain
VAQVITKMKIERVKRGWSQRQLAELAHVASGDLCRIELSKMQPYPGQAERLSEILGLSPKQLQEPVELETVEAASS